MPAEIRVRIRKDNIGANDIKDVKSFLNEIKPFFFLNGCEEYEIKKSGKNSWSVCSNNDFFVMFDTDINGFSLKHRYSSIEGLLTFVSWLEVILHYKIEEVTIYRKDLSRTKYENISDDCLKSFFGEYLTISD